MLSSVGLLHGAIVRSDAVVRSFLYRESLVEVKFRAGVQKAMREILGRFRSPKESSSGSVRAVAASDVRRGAIGFGASGIA